MTSHRSEEHTSELQSLQHLVCRLLLEKKTCALDRKSTRLNSRHYSISHAVFCLKKQSSTPESPPSPHLVRRGDWTTLDVLGASRRAQGRRTSLSSGRSKTVIFLNDTAPPEPSSLSLPVPLPI